MFSLLKRCKYSLYSDTMLHFGSTNPCRITRKAEQTKMYVCTLEDFILVDVVTLLYMDEVNSIGRMLVYIHSQQRNEICENYS